ncbi:fungal-specific transcription factor domain-containing protein [Plectosphaerella plurivora]|uniref:Fungal-specific transcription factor domain-containing protein n=1 Tax=Plectosphaerella plurivora TaxID=936078 RepID=A0A9P9A720_9PEZI|nr:fungal-specific transcription factor domain-containing protein [Plectosphaerella plurivora]
MSREIGTLRALSNGESQYVGSSSGVFFINTVRRAFSAAAASTTRPNEQHDEQQEHPSPEDCILGGEQGPTGTLSDDPIGEPSRGPPDDASDLDMESPWNLGFLHKLPEYSIARRLVMSYFRIWHPLVPFLNGPDCLKDLDSLYAERPRLTSSQSLALLTIFRCIFGISSLDEPDLASWRCTPQQLMPVLGLVALKCDIISVQALLSAQVYFVATMALRNASTVGGIISKSIVQAGLHRCPYRYGHLSPDDRSMRKRVFWSAYVLDRFLSQSLGHPNGIQDSDIDVCLPGCRDLHEPVTNSVASPSTLEQHRLQVQAVLASHVRCSQLIGRMLEIFHKSIHVRDSDGRAVLFLKADLGAWGNNLDDPRTNRSSLSGLGPDPAVFPFISFHYSLLLVNRPSLSLDPDTAEFHAAIQACVAAGTTIIRTMEQQTNLGYPLFWTGYLSAVWMSGLVLAFAFQLKMHSAANATSGISSALKLLTVMGSRWRMALHCRSVLSTLLTSIQHMGDLGANMMTGDGSVFDVFDGATWGSLLDLVDNPGGEFF